MTPPLPVIVQNGFKVFAHPNGTYSAAVKVGNERLYARDYPAGALLANAGLAAMDITEGGQPAAVPPLLDALEASTARAAALLARIEQPGHGAPD